MNFTMFRTLFSVERSIASVPNLEHWLAASFHFAHNTTAPVRSWPASNTSPIEHGAYWLMGLQAIPPSDLPQR